MRRLQVRTKYTLMNWVLHHAHFYSSRSEGQNLIFEALSSTHWLDLRDLRPRPTTLEWQLQLD